MFLTLPPPACAFPGPDFTPPLEPGVCEYSIEQGVCEFHDEGKYNQHLANYTSCSYHIYLDLVSHYCTTVDIEHIHSLLATS